MYATYRQRFFVNVCICIMSIVTLKQVCLAVAVRVCAPQCTGRDWCPILLRRPQREPQVYCRVCILSPWSVDFPPLHWRVSLSTLDLKGWYSSISSSIPLSPLRRDEKKMSFVGGRQPTLVELERVCDGGVLGGGWETWLLMKKTFLKDAYQEVSQSIGTRRQADTHTLRERERLWAHCFNWVAALGHRGGQEFGPLPLWPLTVTAFFLCGATLLYFFVFYNFVLFYDLFVSSLLGGVEVAVGRTDRAGGEMYCHRHVLLKTSLSLFDIIFIFVLLSDLVQSSFFPSPPLSFILMAHFSSTLPSISSPFLFFFPSPGWETGHSCRGTASLSRVALSQPSTKTYRHELPWQLLFLLTALL